MLDKRLKSEVEPKFKVGDFIVNDYCMGKVIELTNDAYLLDTGQGIPFSCEHNVHLWTIQDANDGDVLAVEPIEGYSSSFVAIYKKRNEEDFDSYCFVGFDGKFCEGECGHSTEDIHPSTKEQRDLLFSNMKEAGYEWDAEKKELKKVEQKKDEYNKLTDFETSLKHIMEEAIECGDTHNLKADADMLLRLVQKPAWSEEDKVKDNWELIHEFVNKFGRIPKDEDELNVLVEYVLKRQKPTEWGEEDEKMLNLIIAIFEVNHSNEYFKANELNDPNMRAVYTEEIVTWLKFLKERYTWKPSDEQIEILDMVLTNESMDDNIARILRELREQLKKLKG